MPGGVRDAGGRGGPETDFESGWHGEDRQVPAAGHRVRHADLAGDGDLHGYTRGEADARGSARILADQSSAGLPDLRPGGRMQAAGILGGVWKVRKPVRRGKGPQAEAG